MTLLVYIDEIDDRQRLSKVTPGLCIHERITKSRVLPEVLGLHKSNYLPKLQ